MTIYTRTGDEGKTSLYGGGRVPKDDAVVESCGGIDELTSFLGLTMCLVKNKEDTLLLSDIQKDLYLLMAYLAGAPAQLSFIDEEIARFERRIDALESSLTPLSHFILPRGTLPSCRFHVCRTICRRAERAVVGLRRKKHLPVVRYLNRLSDLLFTLARKYNTEDTVITNL